MRILAWIRCIVGHTPLPPRGIGGEGGQPIDGHTAGVGVVVKPACHHEALGFAQPTGERSVGGVGCPVGAWDGDACAGDGGAIKGDGVGVVCGDGVEGMAEQVLEGGVGVLEGV